MFTAVVDAVVVAVVAVAIGVAVAVWLFQACFGKRVELM